MKTPKNSHDATPFLSQSSPCTNQLSNENTADCVSFLVEKLENCFHQYSDVIAIEDGAVQQTYAQFDLETAKVVNSLCELGVKPGHVVTVSCQNPVMAITAMVALVRLGAIFVPVDPKHPLSRQKTIIDDSKSCLFIHDQPQVNGFTLHAIDMESLLNGVIPEQQVIATQSVHDDTNVVYILYTSGSTGKPKGVYVRHQALINVLDTMHSVRPMAGNFKGSLWTSFSFDVSIFEIFSCLVYGGTLCPVPQTVKFVAQDMFNWMAQMQIKSAYLPPFFIEEFNIYLNNGQSQLQRLLVGVEPLSQQTLWQIKSQIGDVNIINGYGPTECTIFCTYYEVTEAQHPQGGVITPIGGPVKQAKLFIVDENNQLCSAGEEGELLVGGQAVAAGYTDAQLTAKSFVDLTLDGKQQRVYRTGDYVNILADGVLQFKGRNDEQIKIRGNRLELGEISAAYRRSPDVVDAFTVLNEDERGNKYLTAYCTIADIIQKDRLQLKIQSEAASRLLQQVIPEYTVLLSEFELTINGKIDKTRLPAPQKQSSNTRTFTAEEGALAELITQTIDVVIDDAQMPFVNYMIDSIRSLKLIAKINKQYQLSLDSYFASGNTTLETLTSVLQKSVYNESGRQPLNITSYVATDQPVAISMSQERYYDFYENNSINDNFPILYCIEGPVDKDALEKALSRIVDEQLSLRTLFEKGADGLVNQVVFANKFALGLHELNGESPQSFFERVLNYKFDYAKEDLFRVALVNAQNETSYLMINMPDIVFDGWSKMVFQRNLSSYYNNQQHPQNLELLDSNYQSFSAWEKDFISGERRLNAQTFWREHFVNMDATYYVPYDQIDTSIDINNGGIVSYIASEYNMNNIKRICAQTSTTPFYVIYTLLASTLNDIYGQTSFCAMTPVANRRIAETHDLMGCFLNRIALRLDYDPNETLLNNIATAKSTLKDCFSYDFYPFQDITAAFKAATKGTLKAPSSLLIGGQMMHATDLKFNDCKISEQSLDDDILAKNDFSLFYENYGNSIRFLFRYKKAKYSLAAVETIRETFVKKLTSMQVNPTTDVASANADETTGVKL
jgi:amino acid adenylation domain-containing protein